MHICDENGVVSVVIPIYRVEQYLIRCLESVCQQSYKNLEIILVDDGSDDNCPQLVDEWEKKDNRIKVVHKTNGGLSDARNAGMRIASGKYIYFLDSDDFIEKDTISILVDTIIRLDVDAVAFGNVRCDEKGGVIGMSQYKDKIYRFPTEKKKHKFLYRILLRHCIGWEAWNRLYKMDIIKKNNLVFEPNKEIYAEDKCFNVYYSLCSQSIACLEERLYHYTVRKDSIMGKLQLYKINENMELNKRCFQLAEKLGYQYIIEHYDIIILANFLPFFDVIESKDYIRYKEVLKNKEKLKELQHRFSTPFLSIKIWGRHGMRKYLQFMQFMKLIE